jgi:hypothetical protein
VKLVKGVLQVAPPKENFNFSLSFGSTTVQKKYFQDTKGVDRKTWIAMTAVVRSGYLNY